MVASLLRNKWTERILYYVLVPALLLASLWLPPFSMGQLLFHTHYPLVTAEGGVVPGPGGAHFSVPEGAVDKRTRIRLDALTGSDLAVARGKGSSFVAAAGAAAKSVKVDQDSEEYRALQQLPQGVIVYEPFYRLDIHGDAPEEGGFDLPIPYELPRVETADLYGWDGQTWQWLPSQVEEDGLSLRSQLDEVPSLLVIAQRQPQALRVELVAGEGSPGPGATEVPEQVVLGVSGLFLDGEGGLVGDLSKIEEATTLRISNVVDGVIRSDLVDNLIINGDLVTHHVQEIVGAAEHFAAVEIDYGGVDPSLRTEFTSFVSSLGEALGAEGKQLIVKVDAPSETTFSWDTGAYDWRALGAVADRVRIPALPEPAAYEENGAMDRLLTWAAGEVDREKLDLALSAHCLDMVEGQMASITYDQALSRFVRDISADDPDGLLLPGESVNLSLREIEGLSVEFDPQAQLYSFSYQDESDREHTVRLTSGASVARRLQYATRHALGGVSIDGALHPENDESILTALETHWQTTGSSDVGPAVVMSAGLGAGEASELEEKFAYVWTIQDASGNVVGRQVLPLTDPKWTWTAPNNPGDYVIRASLSEDGGESDTGQAVEANLQVPTPTFTPTNTPTPTPTATDTPTPTSTPTNTPTPKPTSKPQAVAAARSSGRVGGYFGYGVQAAMVTDTDHQRTFGHVKGMGFNWVKQQVEWFRYNPGPGQYDWGALDRIVDAANANGVHVLFSVVKAPGWARPPGDTDEGPPADPNTYGAFMRELAARYKGRVKAYEIWNEQNLYYEWGGRGHKLNAAKYVELLKVAYNAVKSVDPGAVVVSGALTPTGVNDGDVAIDDRVYLEQMYQAGLARYCDAVGAHPSGYNNPPDADWRSWQDPSAPTFKGHPSFFFRGTMESYRNIMVKYGDGHKRIWPTEFGWATVENFGCGPAEGYGYAADNSEAEQAQFLVRAYQMGRNWGWVGPMFLWNLNFAPVAGRTDEKAAFGIVREDWGHRPAYAALRDMPK